MANPITFVMPGGRLARGFAYDGPEIESTVVEHTMDDGSIMRETVIRRVEPPAPTLAPPPPVTPQPAPDAAVEAPENAP